MKMRYSEAMDKMADEVYEWDIDALQEFARAEYYSHLFQLSAEELMEEFKNVFGTDLELEDDTGRVVELPDLIPEDTGEEV